MPLKLEILIVWATLSTLSIPIFLWIRNKGLPHEEREYLGPILLPYVLPVLAPWYVLGLIVGDQDV